MNKKAVFLVFLWIMISLNVQFISGAEVEIQWAGSSSGWLECVTRGMECLQSTSQAGILGNFCYLTVINGTATCNTINNGPATGVKWFGFSTGNIQCSNLGTECIRVYNQNWWRQSTCKFSLLNGAVICTCKDIDGDGYSATNGCNPIDCNDNNANVYPNATELCNGVDDNCDSDIDENLIQQCGISDIGECRYGTQVCSSGVWGSCTGQVLPSTEVCDGADNDCDGTVDEDCACIDGETRQCGQTDVGACQYGTETCLNGQWGSCVGTINPIAEINNNIDDDCDGTVDEGFCEIYTDCNDNDICTTDRCVDNVCSYEEISNCISTTYPEYCKLASIENDILKLECQPPSTVTDDYSHYSVAEGPPYDYYYDEDYNGTSNLGVYWDCDAQLGHAGRSYTHKLYIKLDNITENRLPNKNINKVRLMLYAVQISGYGTDPDLINIGDGWYEIDITGFYNSWIINGEFFKLSPMPIACGSGVSSNWIFTASEAGPPNAPKFIIEYLCSPGDAIACPMQQGVCAGSFEICTIDQAFMGCNNSTYLTYSPDYEITEISCDGLDNDCDGFVDEGCDDDNDTYCDSDMTVTGIPDVCLRGPGDCNDQDNLMHPDVLDICDYINNDCDNLTDEDCCWTNEECDDGDECTKDLCTDRSCTYEFDYEVCCINDSSCDDNEPCTHDYCLSSNKCYNEEIPSCFCDNSYECEDYDKCTTDKCVDGRCNFEFSTDLCCVNDSQCDDGYECSNDLCLFDECVHSIDSYCSLDCSFLNPEICDDRIEWTVDRCVSGKCDHQWIPQPLLACDDDYDCFDYDGCTSDSCVNGYCTNEIVPGCFNIYQCINGTCGKFPCTDFDRDGFSREGYGCGKKDCYDFSAAVNPGAEEVLNWIDDDCNGIIDDISGVSCVNDSECDDRNGCTIDFCYYYQCYNYPEQRLECQLPSTNPPCEAGYALCSDNLCRPFCGDLTPACNNNSICEEGEGCSCGDCDSVIPSTTTKEIYVSYCVDECGDGGCDNKECRESGCVCPETVESCVEDCEVTNLTSSGFFGKVSAASGKEVNNGEVEYGYAYIDRDYMHVVKRQESCQLQDGLLTENRSVIKTGDGSGCEQGLTCVEGVCNYALCIDIDGDGFGENCIKGGDCNDYDENINPEGKEICNGFDDDCDCEIPSNEQDKDGDGFMACEFCINDTTCYSDCDDHDNMTNPYMNEICGDKKDNNCNGDVDEGCCTDNSDCDDGDYSTFEYCEDSNCYFSFIPCEEDSDCDDQSPWTDDFCNNEGRCEFGPYSCNTTEDCDDTYECSTETCVGAVTGGSFISGANLTQGKCEYELIENCTPTTGFTPIPPGKVKEIEISKEDRKYYDFILGKQKNDSQTALNFQIMLVRRGQTNPQIRYNIGFNALKRVVDFNILYELSQVNKFINGFMTEEQIPYYQKYDVSLGYKIFAVEDLPTEGMFIPSEMKLTLLNNISLMLQNIGDAQKDSEYGFNSESIRRNIANITSKLYRYEVLRHSYYEKRIYPGNETSGPVITYEVKSYIPMDIENDVPLIGEFGAFNSLWEYIYDIAWAMDKNPHDNALNIHNLYIGTEIPVQITDKIKRYYPVKFRLEEFDTKEKDYWRFAKFADESFELLKNYSVFKADKRMEIYQKEKDKKIKYQLMRELRGHLEYVLNFDDITSEELKKLKQRAIVEIIEKEDERNPGRIIQYIRVTEIKGQTDFEKYKDYLYNDYIRVDDTFVYSALINIDEMIKQRKDDLEKYMKTANPISNIIRERNNSINKLIKYSTYLKNVLSGKEDITKDDPKRYVKALTIARIMEDSKWCLKILPNAGLREKAEKYKYNEILAKCIEKSKIKPEKIPIFDKTIFFKNIPFAADIKLKGNLPEDDSPDPKEVIGKPQLNIEYKKGIPDKKGLDAFKGIFSIAELNWSKNLTVRYGDTGSKEFDIGIQCENPGFTHILKEKFEGEETPDVEIANKPNIRESYPQLTDDMWLIPEKIFCEKELQKTSDEIKNTKYDETDFCIPLLIKLQQRRKLFKLDLWTRLYNEIFLSSKAGEKGNEVHCALYLNDEGRYEPVIYYFPKELRRVLDDARDSSMAIDSNDNPLHNLRFPEMITINIITIKDVKQERLDQWGAIGRHILKDYWIDDKIQYYFDLYEGEYATGAS